MTALNYLAALLVVLGVIGVAVAVSRILLGGWPYLGRLGRRPRRPPPDTDWVDGFVRATKDAEDLPPTGRPPRSFWSPR